jgi:two-component system response regulator MtrA
MTEGREGAYGAEEAPKRSILIVDDEAATRKLLRATIEGLSIPCTVAEASDGDAALQLGRKTRPDLILLDIVLPGSSTSGVLVCQEFCKDSRTKVVIVSGQASDPIVQACLSMGAVEFVRKPFSVDDMRAKLERWLAD